jgi:hypothetical protein
LVEHATENRSVGGSIPPLGTMQTSNNSTPFAYFFFFLGAEGKDTAIAVVASSAFIVIGVLLDRLFLKRERVCRVCRPGIGMVFFRSCPFG